MLVGLVAACAGPSPEHAPGPPARDDAPLPHFPRGMVSITFDDGWIGQVTLALPRLQKRGYKGTFYLVPGWFGTSLDGEAFVTADQAKQLVASGQEIAAHSLDHKTLTQIKEPELHRQIAEGRDALAAALGLDPAAIVDFATPHGAYGPAVLDEARPLFRTHRTGGAYLNTPATDPYLLGGVLLEKSNRDYPGRRREDVAELVHEAARRKLWLILVFHGIVDGKPRRATDEPVAEFDRVLDAIASSGLDVVTVREGAAKLGAPAR